MKQKDNIQITLNNLTRNRTNLKDKREKEKIKRQKLTNSNINTMKEILK